MQVRGEGLIDDDQDDDQAATQGDRVVYVLHPNCAVEEM